MQSQRNSVPRRFGFGFNGATTNSSNASVAPSLQTGSSTPEANRRLSTGRLSTGGQPVAKASPSPNRNSVRLSKSEATPPPASPQTKATAAVASSNNVQSPSSTTDTSNSVSEVHTSDSTTTVVTTTTAAAANNNEQSLIRVCVRIRPLLTDEVNEGLVWQWNEKSITPIPLQQRIQPASSAPLDYSMANPNAAFTFDHLFTPEHTNVHIFDDVIKEIVTAGMNGYHGSVFTYGQTSSGKTFTMYGSVSQIGVITQAIQYCFDAINTFPEREFLLRVSYLEVYNEQVKDLLSAEALPIKILFDPKVGTVLSGVKEHVVFNPQQVYQLIKQGESHRHIGVTDMNAQSSRAHTLFKVIIESKERNSLKASPVRVSTLNLVDLAGSENAKMTNSTGERAREAKHINQSLLTLSTIIQRLSEEHQHNRPGKSTQHLPYRDSKLTRLLESALDGNARIAIICNISPTARCMEESVNTLKFGARAKLIKINAKINENLDHKTLLRAYREEIEQLKLRLKELEEKQIVSGPTAASALGSTSAVPATTPTQAVRKERALSHDDDQSIEVTSATKIDIVETIQQIEDKIMNSSHVNKEDDEQQKMLQMIEAMERLILKADNSKQKYRRSFGVSSSETGMDSREQSFRLKPMKSGDVGALFCDEGEMDPRKSFRKSSSFVTGIPINTSHRSQIPRRSGNNSVANVLSKSNSTSSQESLLMERVVSNDSNIFENTAKVLSPKGLLRKKSSFVQQQKADKEIVPISSQSFEKIILRNENNENATEEQSNNDNEHRPAPLKRQSSIPLSDLQQNYNQLESNAERLGVATHHHHHNGAPLPPSSSPHRPLSEKEKKVIYAAASTSRDALDRTGSISPLTMYTNDPSNPNGTEKREGGEKHRPPQIDLNNIVDSTGFVFSPSTTINRGNLPPQSPYEMHFLSGANTPMKNRILRKVKYNEEGNPITAVSEQEASNATALETMRRLAISNDTLDSFNSSVDPRFAAPNDVLMEDDSVLFGVSKMLTMLKDYISKPNKGRPHPTAKEEKDQSAFVSSVSVAPENHSAIIQEGSPKRGNHQSNSPSQSSAGPVNTNKRKDDHGHDSSIPRDEYEKLRQDLSLKDADNHFLQDELEQKDKMLGMLTEGLKEVQESQMQWLTANQDLSQELEKTLLINQILRNEITRLNSLLSEAHSAGFLTNGGENANGPSSSSQQKENFVSEDVTQLLNSPMMQNRSISNSQSLYMTRSRSVSHSHSKSPLRTAPMFPNTPSALTQSNVLTPVVEKESINSSQNISELQSPSSPLPHTPTAQVAISTPAHNSLIISSPLSASSTATTTVASPDSNVWNTLLHHPQSVHIPSTANNVLDWKQSGMDFTNIHNEEELTEFFGSNEEKEKRGGEGEYDGGIITSINKATSALPSSDPATQANLSSANTASALSLDHEDASVVVQVEKIYQSCDSTESFGSIKETW